MICCVLWHIPVFDEKMVEFALYNYHNIPNREGDEYFQVQNYHSKYLAVSKDHSMHFFVSPLELERCTPMSSFLSCMHFGGMYTSPAPSCLWGIFSSDDKMVHRMCPLRTMGTADRFWPLINDKFVIFLGQADTVFIYCSGRIFDSAHFVGLKVLSLPKNCYAKSKSFQFYAGSMVYREDALLKLAPVSLDPENFFHAAATNTTQLTALLRETARDVHIPTQLPFTFGFWQLYGGYIALGCLGLIVGVILVLFVKWKRQPTISPEA